VRDSILGRHARASCRGRGYLVMLQAFFDDSGRGKESDSPVFVLAGYAGSIATFCSFADDWQAVLREEPTLGYVKGKEANLLSGQFAGWTKEQRDERLARFVGLIRKHDLIALSFGVGYRDFNRILREPKGIMKYPYAVAFVNVVAWLMISASKKPEREEIELIFDQGVIGRERAIQAAYEGMKGSIPKHTMDLLVGRPRFEDDKRYLPLQAADLLAWNVRRDYVEQLTKGRWDSPTWTELRTNIRGRALFMDEKELSDFRARKLAANLERLLRE
jgi:fluoride ion exporter CrcB/FEX